MRRRIHDVMRGEEVVFLPPSATVYAAAEAMRSLHRCAVLVMTTEGLEGIFTEQDVVRRVVAARRDPDRITVAEVMTPRPDTIAPDDLALKGLQMMEDGGYRHLPVVQNGRIVGLVSRADFLGEEKAELESERHYWDAIG